MSAASLLASCTAGAPAGANLYSYCANALNYTLEPPAFTWLGGLLIAFFVVYAALAILFAGLLGLRWRRGAKGFFTSQSTRFGSIIVPQSINLSCLCSAIFYSLALGDIATVYLIAKNPARQDAIVTNMVFSGISFVTLFAQIHWDLCATVIHVSGIRRRSLSQFGTSHPRLSLIANALIVGWPAVTTVIIAALFGRMASVGAQATVNALESLQSQLRDLAPSWSGQIVPAQLLPLLPTGESFMAAVNTFIRWQRIAFGSWLAIVALTFTIWLPAVILHVRSLMHQIRMLSGSANKLAATRGSPSTVSGTSAQSTPDFAERRIRYLLRLCWFRVFLAVCLTIAVSLFAVIVLLLTIDPQKTAGDTSRNTFVRLGSLFAPLLLAPPLAIAAAQHPSDAELAIEPSVQAFPVPATLLDFSYAQTHSPSEKTHRRSGSTGSPSKASRWASRSILSKSAGSTADSAVYIMPLATRPAPVTEGVTVDVETVVDLGKDEFSSAKSIASSDD